MEYLPKAKDELKKDRIAMMPIDKQKQQDLTIVTEFNKEMTVIGCK